MERRTDNAPAAPVTIFVCQSCSMEQSAPLSGEKLLAALEDANTDPNQIAITGVDCLAVCERPVTVSFAAPDKWIYVIGDIDPETDAQDVLTAARAVAASPYGVPEMADRPPFFRNGVVSRTPPAGWAMPQ